MIYKEGSRGDMVKRIQKIVGCYPDGIYGKLTTEAVRAWQRAHSLKDDGIVGPATLAAMGLAAIHTQFPVQAQGGLLHGGIFLKKSKRKITDIVVHCTASREGQAMTVEQIRSEHKRQGWADIGYHYVVDLQGRSHIGRDVDISGAHVSGYNATTIGVVYVGGLENRAGVPYNKLKAKDTRTEAQKAELLALLMDLRRLYPTARICGHRDFSPDLDGDGLVEPNEWIKACPSFDAIKEYHNV